MLNSLSLTIPNLHETYAGGVSPVDVVEEIYRRLPSLDDFNVFISTYPKEVVLEDARKLGPYDPSKPLWGIPFAIKDNIDARGLETTAGCPAFAYMPEQDASAVGAFRNAGALLIGKTNLDQFATGLVGTRSPWGPCKNAFDPAYVSGGSSSGSAVAVARGIVSFSLGTDTAGSGRVPAAFNNIVGLKPSIGCVSTRGVVPACKSLDCVSLFALTPDDAYQVFEVANIHDRNDPWSRDIPENKPLHDHGFVFGVPNPEQLEFFGDAAYSEAFLRVIDQMTSIGGTASNFDYTPFAETASLLYEGPWVAERVHAVKHLLGENANSILPVIRTILDGAKKFDALDTFEAFYRLQELKNITAEFWSRADFMLLPTAPTHPTIAAVEADPITRNMELGVYTNFVNLLDLCAVGVPSGFIEKTGLPFGVSLIGPAGSERNLTALASQLQKITTQKLGATEHRVPDVHVSPVAKIPEQMEMAELAVCGAHLSGQPLNHQLTDRGGILVRAAATAPHYRFYALHGGPTARPGLVRQENGTSIELEIWKLPVQTIGTFIDGIQAPLGIGKVELDDGREVMGFLCEEYATQDALDITRFGGWLAYINNDADGLLGKTRSELLNGPQA